MDRGDGAGRPAHLHRPELDLVMMTTSGLYSWLLGDGVLDTLTNFIIPSARDR